MKNTTGGWRMEAFRIYKPTPANLRFLKIRHYDNRYVEVSVQPAAGRSARE